MGVIGKPAAAGQWAKNCLAQAKTQTPFDGSCFRYSLKKAAALRTDGQGCQHRGSKHRAEQPRLPLTPADCAAGAWRRIDPG
jgi:hypothetical protein